MGLVAHDAQKYADAFKEQTGLDVNLTVTGTERRLEPYLEVMLFRAMQELLGNAARHSQASTIKLQTDIGSEHGAYQRGRQWQGFRCRVRPRESSSLGLKLIRERTDMLGGGFEIDSAPGKGTRISFHVPVRTVILHICQTNIIVRV